MSPSGHPETLAAQGLGAYGVPVGSGRDQNCAEVADLPCGAAVRDSKNPAKGHLSFPATEWDAFLSAAHS